jgi:hypothetical protein
MEGLGISGEPANPLFTLGKPRKCCGWGPDGGRFVTPIPIQGKSVKGANFQVAR